MHGVHALNAAPAPASAVAPIDEPRQTASARAPRTPHHGTCERHHRHQRAAAQERIVFDISPLAELGVALHALSEPGHHPGLHGWATATAAGPQARPRRPAARGGLPVAVHLLGRLHAVRRAPGRPRRRTAAPARRSPRSWTSSTGWTTSGSWPPPWSSPAPARYGIGSPSALDDAVRRERALELAAARGPRQVDFTRRLLDDPDVRTRLGAPALRGLRRGLLRRHLAAGGTQLAADARHKTELLRRKGLAEALHAVSPALALDEERTRISADKLADGRTTAVDPAVGAGLTFVPSSFGWPHLHGAARAGLAAGDPLPGRLARTCPAPPPSSC